MAKLSSYLKAINIKPNWIDERYRSPKDQNDMSGLVVPRLEANHWDPNTDLQYLSNIYDCHDLVFSCIELVSSTFGLAQLKVKQIGPNGKIIYVPDHPLQKVLNNPNSTMSGYDLQQSYVVHRLLNGTMASLLIREKRMISDGEANKCPACFRNELDQCPHLLWHFNKGPVTQILPCHPDRLGKKIFETSAGEREYFSYKWENGLEMIIHPDNILTDPIYNPGGSFYGTSPTAQVKRWLEIDLGLTKQVGAYLYNNSIPSFILNIKPQEGSMDQDPSTMLQGLKEKWIRDFSIHGDGNNSGSRVRTPAFVHGELDIHKIQDSLKDIVVTSLFHEIQNRICMVYGVPPNFFAFGQENVSNSSAMEQQEKNFYNRTISKNLVSYKSKIERYVLSSYDDPTLILEWDLSRMGIASFLENERKANILKFWEMGLDTRDSTREKLGMDPIGDELGNDLYRYDVLGTNANGDRLNQPKQPSEDNILKPNPQLTLEAGHNI